MPIGTKTYDPVTTPFTYLGWVELVGGDEADASRVHSGWRWSILPGVRHYGTRIPINGWLVGDPTMYSRVWKTGSATETTFGYMLLIADVDNPAHGVMENQVITNYECAPGDSGGPVYKAYYDSGYYAILYGINWGFSDTGYSVFSLIEAVLDELGGIEPMLGL